MKDQWLQPSRWLLIGWAKGETLSLATSSKSVGVCMFACFFRLGRLWKSTNTIIINFLRSFVYFSLFFSFSGVHFLKILPEEEHWASSCCCPYEINNKHVLTTRFSLYVVMFAIILADFNFLAYFAYRSMLHVAFQCLLRLRQTLYNSMQYKNIIKALVRL